MMDESIKLPRHSISGLAVTFDLELLVRKVESYIAITEQLFELERNEDSSLKAQLIRVGEEIGFQLDAHRRNNPPQTSPFFNNVSLRKSLNMRGFEGIPKRDQTSSYIKQINELEEEVKRQSEQISQYRCANVKMHIKINEGESSDIEECKAQLKASYHSYKEL